MKYFVIIIIQVKIYYFQDFFFGKNLLKIKYLLFLIINIKMNKYFKIVPQIVLILIIQLSSNYQKIIINIIIFNLLIAMTPIIFYNSINF